MYQKQSINILYEDKHLIVCIKPAGVPVQTKSIGTPDMVSLLKNHLSAGKTPYLSVIHRLDQPVGGILVFAKTPSASRGLNRQLQSGAFEKVYTAVVTGTLQPPAGELEHYLIKDGRTNTSRVCDKDTPSAKYAKLHYQIVRSKEDLEYGPLSLVKIQLETGRHHQIRVQFSHVGAPLWGDGKYNPFFQKKRGFYPIALCASRLVFTHPESGKPMEFEITPDWDFFS